MFHVVSEDEVLYTPLTLAHAKYVCRLLNVQSKTMYDEKMKEVKEAEKKKKMLVKRTVHQNTK